MRSGLAILQAYHTRAGTVNRKQGLTPRSPLSHAGLHRKPETGLDPGKPFKPETGLDPAKPLLPYIEQGPIYNAINFGNMQFVDGSSFVLNHPVNTTAVYSVINVFLCPSDPDRLTDPNGHNNYMANSGSAPNCDYGGNAWAPSYNGPSSGPFIWSDSGKDSGLTFGGSSVNVAGIRDGLSNTAAFSERVKAIGSDFTPTSAPFDTGIPTASLAVPPAVDNSVEGSPQPYYQVCKATPPVPGPGNQDQANPAAGGPDDNISGAMWVSGQPALHATSTSCRRTPGVAVRAFRLPTWRAAITLAIVNVLFCDGSVKAIKSTISVNTWWALGSRNGGEVISADQY